MKLSVIVPCLNEAKHIAVQLEALANQSWSESWEVIVCDNNSSDNSIAIAERYKGKVPNLRIFDASHQRGQAHARNVGARAATGDLLAFCDADDEVAPGWVATIGEALTKYDFVASRFEPTKLNEPWVLKSRGCPQQTGIQEYKYPPYLAHAAGSGLGIKRSLHQAIGGFDESMFRLEDTDYCWRLQLAGVKLHFVPEAVVHYRFRHTLTGIYCQARDYAEYNVLLYKKYQPLGMPQIPFCWKTYAKKWARLLRHLPRNYCRERYAQWMWESGWHIGRLQGSIKYRVLAF